MINLDEQISNIIINTIDATGKSAISGAKGIGYVDIKNLALAQTKSLIADYIESIELPKEEDTNVVADYRSPSVVYNKALADCQAKLDEAVKELRK